MRAACNNPSAPTIRELWMCITAPVAQPPAKEMALTSWNARAMRWIVTTQRTKSAYALRVSARVLTATSDIEEHVAHAIETRGLRGEPACGLQRAAHEDAVVGCLMADHDLFARPHELDGVLVHRVSAAQAGEADVAVAAPARAAADRRNVPELLSA